MQNLARGGRVGLRAAGALARRCRGPAAAGLGAAPGPARRAAAAWPAGGGAARAPASFRTFSTGGGGGTAGGGASGGGGGGGGGSGSSGGSGGGGALWAGYLALLDRRPLATKAATAALLNALGDAVAQVFFADGAPFDLRRAASFAFLGAALIGPALHVWYGLLARIVTAAGTRGALARLALDQLAFAPAFIATVVGALMALEGRGAEAPAKLRADLPAIVRSNWALWVPFQFLNFRFVPVRLQVLAANVCALGWNTYMSWAAHEA
jgi:hypothetical protein